RAGRAIPKWAFWPQAVIYSDRVRYVEQLRRYHAVFPPEQVLVIIYDDFRADNAAVLRRVLRFLEVDEDAPVEVPESNRTSRRVRDARINDVARSLNMGRGLVFGSVNRAIKAVTSKRVRRAVLRRVYKRI